MLENSRNIRLVARTTEEVSTPILPNVTNITQHVEQDESIAINSGTTDSVKVSGNKRMLSINPHG